MENITYPLRRLLASLENVIVLGLCLLLSYVVILPIQRIYFHPLSKYPGPRSWAISRIPFAYWSVQGVAHIKLHGFHAKYGDVVRIAPDELSFIRTEACNDIYQPDKITRHQLSRDPKLVAEPPSGTHGLVFTTNEDDHARMRRNLNPMFTETAMRVQEPILIVYINLLVQRLREKCSQPVDIVEWLNFASFDIVGDLTFGEPFGCLETSELHFWVKNVFSWLKSLTMMAMALKLYPLDKILKWMVPKSLKKQMFEHQAFTDASLAKRLDRTDGRQDFLSYAQEHLETPNGMSMGELRETVAILILAGSETTATSLASQIYFLCTHPEAFQRLKEEIRTTFNNSSEISIQSISNLPYTLAVINESLRLFPPAPTSFVQNRITPPQGSIIGGERVAGNTLVSITQFAAFRHACNFKDGEQFIPERWLPEGQDRYGNDNKQVMQPFGLGPRGCIGKSLALTEMKLALANLILNFDFELRDRSLDWMASMKVYAIWEKTPLFVKVTPVEKT